MAIELVRDLIRMDQVIGEEMTQAMVEGDVVVPDSKPDVDKILSVDGSVLITDKEVVDDRVILEGVVNVKALYVSAEGALPLHYMEGSFGFTQQMELPGINNRMDAEVHAGIEHLDSDIVNSRKLNIKCVLNISGKVVDRAQIDMVKDVKGIDDVQVLSDYIEITDTVGENRAHVTVRQEFVIPADQPAVGEILKTDVMIGKREGRITEDRVNINGILKVTTLYIGDDDQNSINTVSYQIPFSNYIDIPGAAPGMGYRVRYSVEDFYSLVKEDDQDQKRTIEYEVVVKAEAKVQSVQQVEMLVDAYSPSTSFSAQKSSLKLKKSMDYITEEIQIKEEVQLPAHCPPITKLCDVQAVPVLTDFGISGDNIVIEGLLCIKALYTTDGQQYSVYMHQDEIPFQHTTPLPEGGRQMDMDIDLYLEDFQSRMLDNDLIEIRAKMLAEIDIEKSYSKEVVIDIEESDEGEKYPDASIVVYVVQPGDTLWKVAKRFGTTIEELVRVNDIQEPDGLSPGQKLIVSRTVKYQLS
jgi:LysM repeat protein